MNHPTGDEAEKHLKDAAARLTEHITDYVIIARCGDGAGGIVFRFSDGIWARGAIRELSLVLDTRDRELTKQNFNARPDEEEDE